MNIRQAALFSIFGGALCLHQAFADAVLDGSMKAGTGGVRFTDPVMRITEDFGQAVGRNLFHSFSEFSIRTGQVAEFSSGSGVSNVLARVTGGSASSLNGELRSTGAANFFLINPRGIVFGPGSSINVGGSFTATTADYITSSDGARFEARVTAPPVTFAEPAAFGFLPGNTGQINVQSSAGLTVPPGQSLNLVGGDVALSDTSLDAPGGSVNVVGVRSAGRQAAEVRLTNGPAATGAVFSAGSERAAVNGVRSTIGRNLNTRKVVIRGGRLTFAETDVAAAAVRPGDGVSIQATRETQLQGTQVTALLSADFGKTEAVGVRAASATLSDGSVVSTFASGSGRGGAVRVEAAGQLTVSGGSSISAGSAAAGATSDVHVKAGSLTVAGDSFLSSVASDTGRPGDVVVQVAGRLELLRGGAIAIGQSAQQAGDLFISAGEMFISGNGGTSPARVSSNLFAADGASGAGGGLVQLRIDGRLEVRDGGLIVADTRGFAGSAIDIAARDVLLDKENSTARTGISATHEGPAAGRSGSVRLAVEGNLSLRNGAIISTDTLAGPQAQISIAAESIEIQGRGGQRNASVAQGISSRSESEGAGGVAGLIKIAVGDWLRLGRGGEIVATTNGRAPGGSIEITGGDLTLAGGSLITAASLGRVGGAGGSVTIRDAGRIEIGNASRVSVETAGQGPGGNASLDAREIWLSGAGSGVFATTSGSGAGGSIRLAAAEVRVSDGAQVAARTTAARGGAGGGISLEAVDSVEVTGGGEVVATTTGSGVGGSVLVSGQRVRLSGPDSILAAESQATNGGGAGGSVVVRAGDLTLQAGASLLVSSRSAAAAGDIDIKLARRLVLSGGSEIAAAAPLGTGGNISVQSGISIELADSRLDSTARSLGGNIRLVTRDLLGVWRSEITAAAAQDGGSIFIDPKFVVLEGGRISADAVTGRGGNVDLIADYLITGPGSSVTASSTLGVDGRVRIDAINIDLTGNLTELSDEVVRAEALLRTLCTVKLSDYSSLIMEGRGGLARAPGEGLPSWEPEYFRLPQSALSR